MTRRPATVDILLLAGSTVITGLVIFVFWSWISDDAATAALRAQRALPFMVLQGAGLLIPLRRQLRERARMTAELQRFNAALSSIASLAPGDASSDPRPDVVDELLRLGLEGVQASVGGLYTTTASSRELTLMVQRGGGLPDRVPAEMDAGPVGEAASTLTVTARDESIDQGWALTGTAVSCRAWRSLPLVHAGELLGVVVFGFSTPGADDAIARSVLEIIADRATAELNGLRLAGSERRSRLGEDHARRQMALLAQGSKALLAGLDEHEEGLRSLLTLVVPDFAAWCAIDLVRDGVLQRVGARHADPSVDAYETADAWTATSQDVLATGRSELRWADEDAPSGSGAPMIATGITSYLVVAIRLHGLSIGTISCGTSPARRGFRHSDVVVVEELAARVATALERVSLYRATDEAARAAANRAAQLRRLMDGAIAIHSERGMRSVADVVASHARRLLSARRSLVVVHRSGGEPVRLISGHHPAGGAPWSLEDDELARLADVGQRTGQAGRHIDAESGEVTGLVAQLSDGFGQPVGLLAVEDKPEGFDPDDEPSLISLAQMASIALENAHLYDTLRSGENRLLALIESAPVAIMELDLEARARLWNAAAAEMLGPSEPPPEGAPLQLHADTEKLFRRLVSDVADDQGTTRVDDVVWRADGTTVSVSLAAAPLRTAAETTHGVLVVAADMSERRVLEEQLVHAQRLEAVAQVAGGVAHDFNNLLTLILGHSELLGRQLGADHPAHADVLAVQGAAKRAAAVTSQLLTISRGDLAITEPFDPRERLRQVRETIRSLVPAHVRLEVAIDPGLGAVRLAPGQFDQVLLNLAINARDAMPEGGDLTVRLLDEEQHIRIDVTDTGRGMDEATRAKCFEPFFTTKGRAGGTGLGLATVYNVVTSAGGRVSVETEPGAGTCFTVLLPRETHVYDVEPTESAARHGNGHVLLVEDEDGLRRLATEALRSAGFVVTSAADGVAALQLVATTGEAPDLLVTDVVMPRLNGVDLARQLTREHPGLQVLFVSGYAESATRDDLEGADVLTKPFALDELTVRVAEMLGRSLDERPA